jgi:hypothetical protein
MVEIDAQHFIRSFLSASNASGVKADPATIQFLGERSIPGHRLYAVTFYDLAGQSYSGHCVIEQDKAGDWRVWGGSWSKNAQMPSPRTYPYVHLGGGGGYGHAFYACGTVSAQGYTIARVRLISKNGIELEDMVKGGLVLFLTDQDVALPVQVELYDQDNNLVSRHRALG